MLRQAVRTRAVAQQSDVAERRIAIDLIAICGIGDGARGVAVAVLRLDPEMAITAAWDAFSRIEAHKIAPSDAVEHAPHFCFGISAQICRRRLAFRAALE